MRVMTVGALDNAFVDTVLRRHIELRLNCSMAVVADIGLRLGKKVFRCCCTVNGVATRTGDACHGVLGAPDLCSRKVLGVAGEAVVEDLLRLQLREGNDGVLSTFRLDVSLSRAVAPFTSSPFRRLILEGNALVVRVAKEWCRDVRMARSADIAADVSGRLGLSVLCRGGEEENQQEKRGPRRSQEARRGRGQEIRTGRRPPP
jgi:hypothetical protein